MAAGARVSINKLGIAAAVNDPAGVVAEDLRRRGNLILNEAKARARVNTGRMRREIALVEGRSSTGRLQFNVISPAQDPDSHNFPYGYLWEQRDHYLADSIEAGKGDSYA